MEVMNRSNVEDFSFYDECDNENELEKTFVTVHADSFNEKEFNNLLNCLDTIRESENKKRNKKKVIKNYCVQVPYIDNSIIHDDGVPSDIFDKTCDEMKNNISQMFSYFDEDVALSFGDDDEDNLESARERFLRNRRKIKELGDEARRKSLETKKLPKNPTRRSWDGIRSLNLIAKAENLKKMEIRGNSKKMEICESSKKIEVPKISKKMEIPEFSRKIEVSKSSKKMEIPEIPAFNKHRHSDNSSKIPILERSSNLRSSDTQLKIKKFEMNSQFKLPESSLKAKNRESKSKKIESSSKRQGNFATTLNRFKSESNLSSRNIEFLRSSSSNSDNSEKRSKKQKSDLNSRLENFDTSSIYQDFDISSKIQNFDTLSKIPVADSKPVIRSAIKKANAPNNPTNSLNKNQVDKIMNEFNRVKINYYSKDNYVEFTNIDYFYCDSDLDSMKSEKVGKLTQNVLSKFETPEVDNKNSKNTMSPPPVVPVPKNSVRDKISMFSKLDLDLTGSIKKEISAPAVLQHVKLQGNPPSNRLKNLIKNTSSANKNQNKCYIRDINTSLQVKTDSSQSTTVDILEKINAFTKLNDVNLLMRLERIVNKFNMSLLHTIDGLMNDDAFTLVGTRMKHLNVETRPSINRFNGTFDGAQIDCSVENVELSAIDARQIQLQMQVLVADKEKGTTECTEINVIFMAQYETDSSAVPRLTTDDVDDENTFFIYFTSLFEPPENELQKARDSNIALSEHQLRVQASLQKLNIPDWYKQYSSSGHNSSANTSFFNKTDVTGILRKRNSDIGRWQGLSSKTTSLSSLGSNRSDRSPVMLSPSAHSHTGAGQTAGFSRWSTSHLNSSQTSPSVSARSSFVRNTTNYSSTMSGQSVTSTGTSQTSDIRNSFRKPYLGWRSQEKLAQPRTPHERLASSMQNQQKIQQPVATPEIQSSIKEVTSAIVHFVNDQTNRGSRSRSVSPSTRCWLESSFVGTKPLESPQTPALEKPFGHSQKINIGPMSVAATNYDSIRINGISADAQTSSTAFVSSYYPSVRSSATSLEEEVILSLLGLPSDMHKSSSEDLANQPNYRGLSTFSTFKPSTPVSSHSTAQSKPSSSQLVVEQSSSHSRRHSESDFQKRMLDEHEDEKSDEIRPIVVRSAASTSTSPAPQYRRVSLDSVEAKRGDLFRCRYPRCDNAATPAEAKKTYKQCHNCTHLYCSRDCRRNHWERGHRRACLHSRVSVLCRQVLSSCKDDPDTLKHLSLLARRGYISQGRGVVRLLFRSPENADIFIKQGFQFLGEVSYVRWPDLLPSEMGPELYSELLRLSTEYKPEGKMLIYVAICVVSEAPGSSTAPVKWERQLVSRCAKLKLCRSIINDRSLFISTNASTQAVKQELSTDVLILTFNAADKLTQKSREIVMANIQHELQQKGINLRKHFPEIYTRLSNYVEGLGSLLPVTIHPRDSNTGRPFVCIIFPQNDAEKFRLPQKQDSGDRVQTIDVGIERTDILLTQSSLNDDEFTEGTKF